MTQVPSEYMINYPEVYARNIISNAELKNLILDNKKSIDNWTSELEEIQLYIAKIQSDHTETKLVITSMKKDTDWISKDYTKMSKQIEALEKISDKIKNY